MTAKTDSDLVREYKERCMRLEQELIESKNAQGDLHLRVLKLKEAADCMLVAIYACAIPSDYERKIAADAAKDYVHFINTSM